MFNQFADYDRDITTFSPEGRLHQVHYAMKAVELGSTSLAITTSNGVVIAAEKRVPSKLCSADSIEKISIVDNHIAVAHAGLAADARTLVTHCRGTAQDHRFDWAEPCPVIKVARDVAAECIVFGTPGEGMRLSRPYGSTLLIAGVDETGPCLYTVDPAGAYVGSKATATGAGGRNALKDLAQSWTPELTLEKAQVLALTILRRVMEETATPANVELVVVRALEPGAGPVALPAKTADRGAVERVSAENIARLLSELDNDDFVE